jgi:hypothetical protein
MSCVGLMIGRPFAGDRTLCRRHHQHAGFHLRFDGERDVHGHLVAVEQYGT